MYHSHNEHSNSHNEIPGILVAYILLIGNVTIKKVKILLKLIV